MNLGPLVWREDDATVNLPGHESVHDAWQRLFGRSLMLTQAVEVWGSVDAEYYRMENGYVAMIAGYGEDAIYEAGEP